MLRALVSLVLLSIAGCGSPTPPGPGSPCARSSDCGDALVCQLDRCREECVGFSDCPAGSVCIRDAAGDGACRLPDEASCPDSPCPAGTSCVGGSCRAACDDATDCAGTACVDGACEEASTTRITCDERTYCGSGICDDTDCDHVAVLSAGGFVTCSLRQFGEVDCAGSDAAGALGDGETTHEMDIRPFLQEVVLPDDATLLSAGHEHACALLVTGALECWGQGASGQIGAAAMADVSQTAIEPDADTARAITDVSAGWRHTCVLLASGAVECFGADDAGQLGDAATHDADPCGCSRTPVAVEGLSDAIAIDAGETSTCAIREDGSVSCWGVAGATPTAVDLPTATSISVGGATIACGLDEEGQVRCWSPGAAPAVVELPMLASQVDAGGGHACALLIDDTVWCWGEGTYGQLGAGTAASATPRQVPGLPRAIDLVAGATHSCALTIDSEIWCWGDDRNGQLSDGTPSGGGETPPRRAIRDLGMP